MAHPCPNGINSCCEIIPRKPAKVKTVTVKGWAAIDNSGCLYSVRLGTYADGRVYIPCTITYKVDGKMGVK